MPIQAPPTDLVTDYPAMSTWIMDLWHLLRTSPSTVVPTSTNFTGTPGQWAYDSNYVYFCYDTDSWGRILLDKVF